MLTYETSIRNIWLGIDAGEILDNISAASTLKKTINQISHNFIEPNSVTVPSSEVFFFNSTESSKEIGDAAYLVIPAAFSSALSQAIDAPVTTLPLQTDSIYKLLTEKKQKELNADNM